MLHCHRGTLQNAWPSVTSSSVQPNGPNAVASVSSEQVSPSYLQSSIFYLIEETLGLFYPSRPTLREPEGGGGGWNWLVRAYLL